MHEQWMNFFLGVTGAAAALTGLLFVAVSINLDDIVKDRILPDRALETIVVLSGALLTSSLMLVPEQPAPWLGLELLFTALLVWQLPVRRQFKNRADLEASPSGRTFPQRVLLVQLATVPAVVAAVLLALGLPAGYAVLALGVLVAFAVSVINGWVLLVEVRR